MENAENKILQKMKKFLTDPSVILAVFMVCAILFVSSEKMKKDISIVADGRVIKIETSKPTVGKVLESAKIAVGQKDKVLPGLDSMVKDDMTIVIKRAVPVTVKADGRDISLYTTENTVQDLLKTEGIVLNDKDKITPALNSNIQKDMQIKIVRVKEDTIVTTHTIACKTVRRTDDSMAKGTTRVLQEGMDGEKDIVTKVVYEDGREVLRQKVGETIKRAPVDRIIAVGTLAWFIPSRGTERVYYTRKLRMKATSYTADYASTGKNPGDYGFGITATGTRVKRNPDGYSTVAVDPRVIPLGTKLYVEGYGFAIAEDTGGAVKGKIIDLYFHPGTKEYRDWDTHYVNVYVIR